MEYAEIQSNQVSLRHALRELEQSRAAARRLHVTCVQRGPGGAWRPAARWQGTRAATEAADRALRLRLAERSLRATGPEAARRRRLRLAEATLWK